MSQNVKVVGMNKFVRALERKTAEVERAVGQEINRSSLRVERRAKKGAPWDTGWLANTIYSHMMNSLNAEVVSPADYSIYVESGTRYMMAQPFVYPALKADWPTLQKNLNKIMRG